MTVDVHLLSVSIFSVTVDQIIFADGSSYFKPEDRHRGLGRWTFQNCQHAALSLAMEVAETPMKLRQSFIAFRRSGQVVKSSEKILPS